LGGSNHRNSFTDINTPTRIFDIFFKTGRRSTLGIEDYFGNEDLLFSKPEIRRVWLDR
jgi:hypothetical protein